MGTVHAPPGSRKAIVSILALFLLIVGGLGIWMRLIRQSFPVLPPTFTPDLYVGTAPETNPWLEPWQRWDTPQYQAIAERGYSAFETAYFTPPLFPCLMRWTAPLFGGNTLAAGLFVSALAFLGCLLALHRLTRFELGDDSAAMRAVVYLASFPAAFFLVAAYNESLFLLGAILCLFFARQGKWLAAGLMGGFAALARIPGTLLLIPLACAAWQGWRRGIRLTWSAPASMAVVLSAWYAFQWFFLHQPPTAILTAQNQRGGHLTFPGLNLVEAVRRILTGQLVLENLLELGFTLAFVVLTLFVWKKLPRLYGVYAVTLMLFFLIRMGSPQPLVSMARYCLEVFPVFLLLAGWGARPWVNRLILYASWIGLLFFSAQFAIWGWVG